jgi:hypothetical protein
MISVDALTARLSVLASSCAPIRSHAALALTRVLLKTLCAVHWTEYQQRVRLCRQYLGTTNLNRLCYSRTAILSAQWECVRGSTLWPAVELGTPPLKSQRQAASPPC